MTASRKSGFLPLSNGFDAFVARAVLAERAKKTLDAQYYILHDDDVGRGFAFSLLKAADRGVRVRLLLDDMFLEDAYDLWLAYLDQHPHIEVRSFNPFSRATTRFKQYLSRFNFVSRRMHNKSFTVDSTATVVGGRNIGNEYFSADAQEDFGDLDVLAVGPVVKEVSESFDAYWNHPLAYPITNLSKSKPSADQARVALDHLTVEQQELSYLKSLKNSAFANAYREGNLDYFWGEGRVIADLPDKLAKARYRTDLPLKRELETEFSKAKSEVIIISPYFVPGKHGSAGLVALAHKGVRVRVLSNGLASNNHTIVHAHYAKYRKELSGAGVELYEIRSRVSDSDRQSVLHAKAYVVDRKAVFVGSLNFDPRSVIENTEIGIFVGSEGFGKAIGKWFDDNINQVAYRIKLSPNQRRVFWHSPSGLQWTEPESTAWERFKMRFYRMLPVERLL